MTKPAWLLTFLLAPVLAAQEWPKEPADFRGVPWAISVQEAIKIIALGCHATGPAGTMPLDRICEGTFNLGGTEIENSLGFAEDHLVTVSLGFKSDAFGRVRDAFIERYGEPTKRATQTMKTRMGAEFMNERLEWTGPKISLSLTRYGENVEKGSAMFVVLSYLQETERRARERAKRDAEKF